MLAVTFRGEATCVRIVAGVILEQVNPIRSGKISDLVTSDLASLSTPWSD